MISRDAGRPRGGDVLEDAGDAGDRTRVAAVELNAPTDPA